MSVAEKIARAKVAQEKSRPHEDVTVSLDASLTAERDRLNAEIDELNAEKDRITLLASQSLALEPDTADVDKKIAAINRKLKKIDELDRKTLITVRVYRAPGDVWFDMKNMHPVRLESLLDRSVGYNTTTMTKAVSEAFARILEDGVESTPSAEEWAEIWPLLAGGSFENLANATYRVNVSNSQRQVEHLKNS